MDALTFFGKRYTSGYRRLKTVCCLFGLFISKLWWKFRVMDNAIYRIKLTSVSTCGFFEALRLFLQTSTRVKTVAVLFFLLLSSGCHEPARPQRQGSRG